MEVVRSHYDSLLRCIRAVDADQPLQLYCVHCTHRRIPRADSVLLPGDQVCTSTHIALRLLITIVNRNMTIEEVSVLFDTGRKGNAQAAALAFSHGKDVELTESFNIDEAERRKKQNVVSHIESA